MKLDVLEGDSGILESSSDEDTFLAGKRMGELAQPGQVLCLEGDLGAGKTVFAKGFACGLGIREPVSSPTFTIVQEYEEGRLPFYHFDAYRIADPDEMAEIGFDDYLFGEGVCLIEWAGLIQDLIPPGSRWICIERDPEKGTDYRKISWEVRSV